jgi:hypothetical protein
MPRAEWAPEPVWTTWRSENSSCLHRDSNPDPSVVKPVASRYPGSLYTTILTGSRQRAERLEGYNGIITGHARPPRLSPTVDLYPLHDASLSPFYPYKNHYVWHFLLFLVGWEWVFWSCGHYWSIVPVPEDRWWWLLRNWWNEGWQGKPKYSEETCPSATLFTTNPTWLDPGLNPGRRCGKPATTHLSYGAAHVWHFLPSVRIFSELLTRQACVGIPLYCVWRSVGVAIRTYYLPKKER